MKRIKAQALALVLIVIAVSVVIAYGITSRVIEDIKQQGEERASTRAESLAESAVEQITQELQSGELTVADFGASQQKTFNLTTDLQICDPNATSLDKKCDPKSDVQVNLLKQIIQFKLFSSESIEVHMSDPKVDQTNVTGANGTIVVHLKAASADFKDILKNPNTKLILKTFFYEADKTLQVGSECVLSLSGTPVAKCVPDNQNAAQFPAYQIAINRVDCSTQSVEIAGFTAAGEKKQLGDTGNYCFTVIPQGTVAVGFYRIKPLLPLTKADGTPYTSDNQTPYVDISVTGRAASTPLPYTLPDFQMAVINAGVYTGEAGVDQQVFQQTTRFMLLHKAVPEIADYVLYNGSDKPIVKSVGGSN